jgi:hypothetical protein
MYQKVIKITSFVLGMFPENIQGISIIIAGQGFSPA